MLERTGTRTGEAPAVWRAVARRVSQLSCLGVVTLVVATLLLGAAPPAPAHAATVVSIPDTQLNAAVRRALSKPTGDITVDDMQSLTYVSWKAEFIKDLTGLEYATNLFSVNLKYNEITDITPLAGLTKLETLYLGDNQITNITPVANLTKLYTLELDANPVADITSVGGLTSLQWLDVTGDWITDISPVASLTKLTTLYAGGNMLTDIAPLQDMRLAYLHVDYNYLDISPGSPTMNIIKALQGRGANVTYSPQRNADGPGSLSGNVTAGSGIKLSGVSVTVAGQAPVTTDSEGAYTVSGIPAGPYKVTFAKSAYTSQTLSVTIASGHTTTRNVALVAVAKGSLTGNVSKSTGVFDTFLAGVSVSVPGYGAVTTDYRGDYTVSDIASGPYNVTYSKSGYASQTIAVTISTGTATHQNVLLVAISGATGTLSGTVTSGGSALAGVSVSVAGYAKVTTTSSGTYTVSAITAGLHYVGFTKSGYASQTIAVTISSGGTTTQNVTLVAAGLTLPTTTKLSGPASVEVNKALKLHGTVSPTAAPGKVTIVKTHLVGKKWKAAGSAKVTLVGGKFTYSFKPALKGSWRFVAKFSGSAAGTTTYKASKSAVKGVKVK